MTQPILWTALSRFHDWSDKEFPVRMLQAAIEADLVGPVEWLAVQEGPRQDIRIDRLDRLAEELFSYAKPDRRHKIITLEAGGSSPAPWSLTALLPPFIERDQRVWGYGVVTLLFDQSQVPNREATAVLLDQFFEVNNPEVVEYACIHPYESLQALRTSAYKQPLTFTAMFGGVFWANFLGTAQLEFFDTNKLGGLSADRVQWVDDRGLFLVVAPDLTRATEPETEKVMERLTADFRRALK